jgi:hypothetical protein
MRKEKSFIYHGRADSEVRVAIYNPSFFPDPIP